MFARYLLDVCLMFVRSCKRGITGDVHGKNQLSYTFSAFAYFVRDGIRSESAWIVLLQHQTRCTERPAILSVCRMRHTALIRPEGALFSTRLNSIGESSLRGSTRNSSELDASIQYSTSCPTAKQHPAVTLAFRFHETFTRKNSAKICGTDKFSWRHIAIITAALILILALICRTDVMQLWFWGRPLSCKLKVGPLSWVIVRLSVCLSVRNGCNGAR